MDGYKLSQSTFGAVLVNVSDEALVQLTGQANVSNSPLIVPVTQIATLFRGKYLFDPKRRLETMP